jgi:hypothetical protein
VHRTQVEHYVKASAELWRVVCAGCGMAVEDLGAIEASEVASVLGRRMCGGAIGGLPAASTQDPAARSGGLFEEDDRALRLDQLEAVDGADRFGGFHRLG